MQDPLQLSTEVTEEDLNEAYTDEYGVKFSPDGKRLLKGPWDLVHYIVPDSIKVICDRAFSECHSLRSLTLPASLTSIGESAFSECSSLSSLTLPASLMRIEGNPFTELRLKLHSASPHFYIENDVLFTGDKTKLIACLSDKTAYQVPESVTSIGEGAFRYCSSLSSLTLPASLTSIGEWAFSECSSLTDITLPTSLKSIGKLAFSRCESLSSLTLPASLTSIGDRAFSYCSSLAPSVRKELRQRFGDSVLNW